ncbi:hypothetical protein GBAR_LOCUS26161 [Geodia barretti]|uniref:Carbohydrate ABC transporter permease n=1 Tax=Geodia barretti TaxID=519541 RepID=A0AA35TGZ8_GEOBA|nr:hypothetical protein GBAR_LOCUS26161 [Geodia barretti]
MRAINALAVIVVIVWLIPVAWVALTSVKPTKVINAETPTFYSFEPTGEHYVEIFDRFRFDRAIVNSLITVGVSTLIVMILALPAAYAVAEHGAHGGRYLGPCHPLIAIHAGRGRRAALFQDGQLVHPDRHADRADRRLCRLRSAVRGLDSARIPARFAEGGGGGSPARRAELAADHLPLILADGGTRHRGDGHLHLRLQLERVSLCALPHLRQGDDDAGRAAKDHRPLQRAVGFAQRRRGDTAIADDRRRVPAPATHRARPRARRGEIGPP